MHLLCRPAGALPLSAYALTFGLLIATALFVQSANTVPRLGRPPAREKAIRECNVRAEKYHEHTWGDVEIYTYRACMREQSQQE